MMSLTKLFKIYVFGAAIISISTIAASQTSVCAGNGDFIPANCGNHGIYGSKTCLDNMYSDGMNPSGLMKWDLFLPPSWTPNTSQCYPLLIWLYSGGWHEDTYLNATEVSANRNLAQSIVNASAAAYPNDPSKQFIVAIPYVKLAKYRYPPATLNELKYPAANLNYTDRPFAIGSPNVPGIVPTSEGLSNLSNFLSGARNPALAVHFKQDASKISIGGVSSAGHIALMEATSATSASATPLRCVYLQSAPSNLVDISGRDVTWSSSKWLMFGAFPRSDIGTYNGQNIYYANSPIYRMSNYTATKTIIVHGVYDSLVPYSQAIDFYNSALYYTGRSPIMQSRQYNVTNTYGQVPNDPNNLLPGSHETLDSNGQAPGFDTIETLLTSNCV